MSAVVTSLHPWVKGACSSDYRGTETAEGRSKAEDGCVIEVTGIPEVLVAGAPEAPIMWSGGGGGAKQSRSWLCGYSYENTRSDGHRNSRSADHVIRRVTIWSAVCRCLGCKYPRLVKRAGNDATWGPGPGINEVLTGC